MKFLLTFIFILALASGFYIHADTLLEKALDNYTEQEALKFIQELKASGKQADLYPGIVYHNLSRHYPEKYLHHALTHLQAAYENNHDPVALAYWGSALTMRAGMAADSGDLASAIADLEQGIQKIDTAVNKNTANVLLRFLRMINSLEVTENSPLDRLAVAKEDLQYLQAHYNAFNNSNKSLYKLCEAKIAIQEDSIEYALSCLEQAIRLNPQSATAREAKAILLEWEE